MPTSVACSGAPGSAGAVSLSVRLAPGCRAACLASGPASTRATLTPLTRAVALPSSSSATSLASTVLPAARPPLPVIVASRVARFWLLMSAASCAGSDGMAAIQEAWHEMLRILLRRAALPIPFPPLAVGKG
ncbi:hypothetical protein BOS5A_110205 [Bosea sp. EC-HK365B]|nr:hypothetical protein BOSE21B_10205 [Bosea sp. 21B]CAD5268495.1 hypothetical protein BOSE7B_170001 [Bosea sp. 7B]VVT51054.1 hypothetical protein BOS5A_110205 [Bosea sp. EC-HK365B]